MAKYFVHAELTINDEFSVEADSEEEVLQAINVKNWKDGYIRQLMGDAFAYEDLYICVRPCLFDNVMQTDATVKDGVFDWE